MLRQIPGESSARSRSPISPASVALTIARISSISVADFCAGAVPFVRRIPFIVFATIAALRGGIPAPRPCELQQLRLISAGRSRPSAVRRHSAMNAATVSGLAGIAQSLCASAHAQNARQSLW